MLDELIPNPWTRRDEAELEIGVCGVNGNRRTGTRILEASLATGFSEGISEGREVSGLMGFSRSVKVILAGSFMECGKQKSGWLWAEK